MSAAQIPSAAENGVRVKILAGESMGVQSPVVTRTPSYYLDFTLDPGTAYAQAVPIGWTTFAYILEVGALEPENDRILKVKVNEYLALGRFLA